MKRTVDVNLNGIHYVIDEDAYTLLEQYLNDIERHFSKEEERDVVTDIEARIAELFSESLIHGRNVVDIEITRQTIDRIGRPEQMYEDNGESYDKNDTQYNKSEKSDNGEASQTITSEDILKKLRTFKLYRDTDDVMVSGVCSGLALRARIETWIIRFAFILFSLATHGLGLLIYFAMWILVPKAITVAQKLEMRGEAADINSIQNFKAETNPKSDAQNIMGKIIKLGIIIIICSYVFAGCKILHINMLPCSPFYDSINALFDAGTYGNGIWYILGNIGTAVAILLPLIVAVIWLSRQISGDQNKPFHIATQTTLWIIWIAALLLTIIARF